MTILKTLFDTLDQLCDQTRPGAGKCADKRIKLFPNGDLAERYTWIGDDLPDHSLPRKSNETTERVFFVSRQGEVDFTIARFLDGSYELTDSLTKEEFKAAIDYLMETSLLTKEDILETLMPESMKEPQPAGTGYSPEIVIGTYHISENIRPVLDILVPFLGPGIKVGAETWTYPKPIPEGATPNDKETLAFFNGVGQGVEAQGAEYIPLLTKYADIRKKRPEEEIKRRILYFNEKIGSVIEK